MEGGRKEKRVHICNKSELDRKRGRKREREKGKGREKKQEGTMSTESKGERGARKRVRVRE